MNTKPDSLLSKIIKYMKSKKTEVNLKDIYTHFDDQKHTTIRGRINEAVGKKIIRTGKGTYMLLGAEIEAVIEKESIFDAAPKILASNIYYNLIFLDIPYKTQGQKSYTKGRRDFSPYATIDPEEFEKILIQAEKMLKDETSQIYFMISGGSSSARDANKYIKAFESTSLQFAAKGYYQKLNKDGSVCNMAQHKMPPEQLIVYSPNGKLLKPEETQLEFDLVRPKLARYGGYPTEKPFAMAEQIVKQATNEGDTILDMFAGSGVFVEAALKLFRTIHAFDISDLAIEHILKRMHRFKEEMHNRFFGYSNQEISNFNRGVLF